WVFAVSSDGGHLVQKQTIHDPSDGTVMNIAVDPANQFLYVVANHDDPEFPRPVTADGNFVDAFRIRSDGTLVPISSVGLPVQGSSEPFGLTVLGKSCTSRPSGCDLPRRVVDH